MANNIEADLICIEYSDKIFISITTTRKFGSLVGIFIYFFILAIVFVQVSVSKTIEKKFIKILIIFITQQHNKIHLLSKFD